MIFRWKSTEVNLWAGVLVLGIGALLATGHPIAALFVGAAAPFVDG